MSSRVGTAIPASRSTALSSPAVGFTRSIQTAPSGSASRSATTAFFSEVSAGTNTDSMGNSRTRQQGLPNWPTQQDLVRFWQALDDGRVNGPSRFVATGWRQHGPDPAAEARLPKKSDRTPEICGKKDTATVP